MKRNICNLMIGIAAFATLSGCYEDKGNYSYADIDELTITVPDLVEAMAYAEDIEFQPKITSSVKGGEVTDGDGDYEFSCRLDFQHVKDGVTYKWLDINPEKKKDIKFYADIPAGSYTAWYSVKNTLTGVVTNAKVPVAVKSPTFEGWMVLSNNGESREVRLDMIFADSKGEWKVARGVSGDELILHNASKISFVPNELVGREAINLLTSEGSYRLDDDLLTLKPSENMKMLYFMVPSTPGEPIEMLTTHYYTNLNPNATLCVTTEGNAYCIVSQSNGASFENPMNAPAIGAEPTYKVSPHMATSMVRKGNSSSALFYDVTNKQFKGWSYYSANVRLLFDLSDDEETQPKDLFSFQTGMDIIDMVGTQFDNGMVYSVLQDNSGHRHVYGINLGGYNNILKTAAYDDITTENFDSAVDYEFHSKFPYMFYCRDNNIYCYGLTDKRLKDHIVLEPNEKVTMLKFNLYQNMMPSKLNKWKDPDFQEMQYRLIVASTTGNQDGGIVRFYDIDINGKMTQYATYTGLGEDIVDVTYRERRL